MGSDGNVRVGVCFNGSLGSGIDLDQDDGVFQFYQADQTFRDGATGTTLFPTDQYPTEFENVWDRRRIAGIKMKYMPYYNNFPAAYPDVSGDLTSGTGTISTAQAVNSGVLIPHAVIAWDRDGIEDPLTTVTYDDLRASMASKSVRLDRGWKVYRKSTVFPSKMKFPYHPLTDSVTFGSQPQHNDSMPPQVNIWGQWVSKNGTNALNSGAARDTGFFANDDPSGARVFHVMLVSKDLNTNQWIVNESSLPIGQIDFTVYHVLADRR